MEPIRFKQADSASELAQIHALNHRVFAEEIAQHPRQASGLLVDRLHHQNRYFIAIRGPIVIGMISVHPGPEFSIARRLPHPAVMNDFARPLEVRLLAIDPAERNRTLLAGLLWQAYDFAASHRFSHILISGLAERESMYRKLGFRALGPPVPEGLASFIPMVMTVQTDSGAQSRKISLFQQHWRRAAPSAKSAKT